MVDDVFIRGDNFASEILSGDAIEEVIEEGGAETDTVAVSGAHLALWRAVWVVMSEAGLGCVRVGDVHAEKSSEEIDVGSGAGFTAAPGTVTEENDAWVGAGVGVHGSVEMDCNVFYLRQRGLFWRICESNDGDKS